MPDVVAVLGIVVAAAVAFVLSVGVGILVGRRLDRVMESRASASRVESVDDSAVRSESPGASHGQEVGVDGR